jgi:phosphatidylglycerol---prolipoprotein diacylglyceryl transferase
MFPILFRIPLPHRPLMLWWALAVAAGLSLLFGFLSHRRGDKNGAVFSLGLAFVITAAGYIYRTKSWEATALPIYSFGVMLAVSLIAGWYLTLYLTDKAGLPKETMANCYVLTAIVALVSARLSYAAMNTDQFKGLEDILAIRKGGYFAFGGFLGGLLASWLYLRSQEQKLLPWGDTVAPAMLLGLGLTRVGSYLYGSDFGKPLGDNAPGFLKKLGTFPKWSDTVTQVAGDGPEVYLQHVREYRGSSLGTKVLEAKASLAVHPTQLYEVIFTIVALVAFYMLAKKARFRGQLFYFALFSFSAFRFALDFLRDDKDKGEFGPSFGLHSAVAVGLLLVGVAFAYGMALWIADPKRRTVARVVALLPGVIAFFALRPSGFDGPKLVQYTGTQVFALGTCFAVSYLFSLGWIEAAREAAQKRKKKKKKKVEEEDEAEAEEEAAGSS